MNIVNALSRPLRKWIIRPISVTSPGKSPLPKRQHIPLQIASAHSPHPHTLVSIGEMKAFKARNTRLSRLTGFRNSLTSSRISLSIPLPFDVNRTWSPGPTKLLVSPLSRFCWNNVYGQRSYLIQAWSLTIHIGKRRWTKIMSRLKRSPSANEHRVRTEWRSPTSICHAQRDGKSHRTTRIGSHEELDLFDLLARLKEVDGMPSFIWTTGPSGLHLEHSKKLATKISFRMLRLSAEFAEHSSELRSKAVVFMTRMGWTLRRSAHCLTFADLLSNHQANSKARELPTNEHFSNLLCAFHDTTMKSVTNSESDAFRW